MYGKRKRWKSSVDIEVGRCFTFLMRSHRKTNPFNTTSLAVRSRSIQGMLMGWVWMEDQRTVRYQATQQLRNGNPTAQTDKRIQRIASFNIPRSSPQENEVNLFPRFVSWFT